MSDLRNATLSHIVADVLRQSLYDGVYLCGDRLVELTISQEMNVSQNTARDALGLLENEGWVTRKARHGVYVQPLYQGSLQGVRAQARRRLALRLRAEPSRWGLRAEDGLWNREPNREVPKTQQGTRMAKERPTTAAVPKARISSSSRSASHA
jgi:DNA-binding transcriptional regulator YhcF (GntR family)